MRIEGSFQEMIHSMGSHMVALRNIGLIPRYWVMSNDSLEKMKEAMKESNLTIYPYQKGYEWEASPIVNDIYGIPIHITDGVGDQVLLINY